MLGQVLHAIYSYYLIWYLLFIEYSDLSPASQICVIDFIDTNAIKLILSVPHIMKVVVK